MKKIIALSLLSLFVYSCSSSIDGEGVATAQKSFTVDQINNLEINCNCNVTLVPGNEIGVKAESHQNILDNLTVEGKNGNLVITEKSNVNQYSAYDIFVHVTRDLKDLSLTGLTALKVSGTLNVDDIEIELRDQARLDNSYLITNNISLSAHDQTVVDLKGTAMALIYKGYNQSKAELFAFETNDAQITTTDNAILNINSRKSLAGSVKGNSIVTYMGDPSKDTKIADNAQVIKK